MTQSDLEKAESNLFTIVCFNIRTHIHRYAWLSVMVDNNMYILLYMIWESEVCTDQEYVLTRVLARQVALQSERKCTLIQQYSLNAFKFLFYR